MSFTDEMKQIHTDYENEFAQKDEKEVEKTLDEIKSEIRVRVGKGEKKVSNNEFICNSIQCNQPEYVVFSVHSGSNRAEIRWSLTQKMKNKLKSLRALAANDGITITDLFFRPACYIGDDEENWYRPIHKDHGVLYVTMMELSEYPRLQDPEEWRIYVSCGFCYSL